MSGAELKKRVDAVNAIITKYISKDDETVLQLALNSLLSNSNISTIIPGVSKVDQLKDIFKLCDIERMSYRDFKDIEKYVTDNFS